MIRPRRLAVGLVLLLAVAACAGDDNSGGEPPSTTQSSTDPPLVSADPCDDVELEESEIGVTDDKIVVEVVADIGGSASGLFRGSVDAVKAWADAVNERGGLACREVEVREWDAQLSAGQTAEGTLDACEKAVAMVGTSALLLLDTANLVNCADEGFAATGVPDFAERAVEVPHQCSPSTFAMAGRSGACPHDGGVRHFTELIGPFRYLAGLQPGARGTFVVPGETPTSTAASETAIHAAQLAGTITIDAVVAATVHDRDQAVTNALEAVAAEGSSLVYSDAHAHVLPDIRKNASGGAVDSVQLWACSATCYSKSFRDRGGDVEGTYVWLPHIPLEEADSVPALAAYVDAIGGIDNASPSGVGAWAAAITFELVIERIVERDGLNGITRDVILGELEALRAEGGAMAGGIYGSAPHVDSPPSCYVMLQVRNGQFRRVHPAEPGTLDCSPDNVFGVDLDPALAGGA